MIRDSSPPDATIPERPNRFARIRGNQEFWLVDTARREMIQPPKLHLQTAHQRKFSSRSPSAIFSTSSPANCLRAADNASECSFSTASACSSSFPPVPEVHRNSPVPAVALSFFQRTGEVPPGSSSHTWFQAPDQVKPLLCLPKCRFVKGHIVHISGDLPGKIRKKGIYIATARHGSPSIPRQMPSHHRSHGTPATPHRRTPRHMPVKDSQRSVWHWKTA